MREEQVANLYDALSLQVATRNWFVGGGRLRDLTMHKQLKSGDQGEFAAGGQSLDIDERMMQAAGATSGSRILDAGCGFGASIFRWQARLGGTYEGLTISAVQSRVARARARSLKLEDACQFYLRSYDEPLPSSNYDVIITLESLLHSQDLCHTIANLAAGLGTDGRLVMVEDCWTGRDSVSTQTDCGVLCEQWACSQIHSIDDYRHALANAGLSIIEQQDLTSGVRYRDHARLRRLERRYARWQRYAPPVLRRVLAAYRGGVVLERMYGAGHMRYLMMVAVRQQA